MQNLRLIFAKHCAAMRDTNAIPLESKYLQLGIMRIKPVRNIAKQAIVKLSETSFKEQSIHHDDM